MKLWFILGRFFFAETKKHPNQTNPTWMSKELSNYLVSWVITYLRDLQPTFTGVIIHLLSTMDIQVRIQTPR